MAKKAKKPKTQPEQSLQIVLQTPQPEPVPDMRINPEHPDRPRFGFSPAPFVSLVYFKDLQIGNESD